MIGLVAVVVLPIADEFSWVVHAASWVGSVFGSGSSGSPETVSVSSVTLVTQTWLADETKAVNYYCKRAKSGYCVSVPFVQAIMMQESGGNPTAGSYAGAMGLMQVMPSHFTAAQSPFSPLTNIMAGVGYLDENDALFQGNLPLVAAGYNAGSGIPEDWIQEYQSSNWSVIEQNPAVELYSGGQTYDYVNAVMGYFATFSGLATGPGVTHAGTL